MRIAVATRKPVIPAAVVSFTLAYSGGATATPFQYGATVGYEIPGGSVTGGRALSDTEMGAVLLRIDGSYRVHPYIALGLYLYCVNTA